MKRTWVKVICLTLALAFFGAGLALAAKPLDVTKALSDSYELLAKQKYAPCRENLECGPGARSRQSPGPE